MTPDPDNTYLMRFQDGPMATKRNIDTLAGTTGNMAIPKDIFGWPLPDRLGVLTHDGVENVAFWDADDPAASELPPDILDSPNAIVYRKLGQSQLPEDVEGVVRGALYCLEKD